MNVITVLLIVKFNSCSYDELSIHYSYLYTVQIDMNNMQL